MGKLARGPSFPNLSDTRSDISRATTLSVRSFRSSRPRTPRTPDVYCQQDIIDLARVTANFGMDLDSQYRPASMRKSASYSDVASVISGSGGSTGSGVTSVHYGHARGLSTRVVDFQHTPTMLLPVARPRVRTVAWESSNARTPTAIPADPRSTLILCATGGSRPSSAVSFAPSSDPDFLDQESEGVSGQNDYLDNFADYRRRAPRVNRKSATARGPKTGEEGDDCEGCPECRKLFEKFGGKLKFLSWFGKQYGPSAVGKQGPLPHYCNFVKKLQLKQRPPTAPHPGHSHVRNTSQNGGQRAGLGSAGSGRGSAGTEGRPNSPSSLLGSGNGSSDGDGDGKGRGSPGGASVDVHTIRIPTPQPEVTKEEPPETPAPAWSEKKPPVRNPNDDDTSRNRTTSNNSPGSPKSPEHPSSPTTPPPTSQRFSSRKASVVRDREGDAESATRRQSCVVVKKRKKSGKARRRTRGEGHRTRDAMSETKTDDDVVTEVGEQEPKDKATGVVPDLPEAAPQEKKKRPSLTSKPDKGSLSFITPMPDNPAKNEDTPKGDTKSNTKYDYGLMSTKEDYNVAKKPQGSWSQGRLALSQQASRFELPMDMKLLEQMTPIEYLTKYCVITTRRYTLYQKVYMKHKDGKTGMLSVKDMEKALKDVLVNTVTSQDVEEMCKWAKLEENTKINTKLFAGFAAMVERVLYPKFITEDTIDLQDHKKEKIECADFGALDWKFHGVNVNPHMRRILENL